MTERREKNRELFLKRVEIENSAYANVELNVRPLDPPTTFEEFVRVAPSFSIALDGYLDAPPQFNASGPHLNLDHHIGVNRLSTRATCGQALISVRQGLFKEAFRDEEGPRANVFVNDCDEDVCFSWFVLKYGGLSEKAINPRLNRLLAIVDNQDTTAGTYPYPTDYASVEEVAWIVEPYKKLRLSGQLDRKDSQDFERVIHEVEERIKLNLIGEGQRLKLDTRYDIIGESDGFKFVREVGAQAKEGMVRDGISAYIAVRDRPDGNTTYTVARISLFVPFDLAKIFRALNKAEGNPEHSWGGSDTIGGSPRAVGSRLSLQEVEEIVNQVISSSK